MTCVKRGVLYLAWTMAAPWLREAKKQEYDEHCATCPVCRGEWQAEREIAERQPEHLPVDALIEAGK